MTETGKSKVTNNTNDYSVGGLLRETGRQSYLHHWNTDPEELGNLLLGTSRGLTPGMTQKNGHIQFDISKQAYKS